jgi:hypothetical protein
LVRNFTMAKKLLFTFCVLLAWAVSYGQYAGYDTKLESLYKFSKSYFRSDPFTGEFSGFLKHLINDPAISEKFIRKKTDTSFYTFHGTYTGYNPFFFKPKRVEILLEETPVEYGDSLHTADTIFTYQLLAYANDDATGADDIKKEFEKIHRQTSRKFDSNYKEFRDGDEITVAIHNYFVPLHWLAPLSIAWGRLKNSGELVLNITMRIKMSGNRSVLPAALYDF